MEWPKLKNIVLAILLAANLFLLALVVGQELQNSRLQIQSRADALRFLAARGVAVAENQVPDRMTLLPQQVERDLAREEELAAQLLGKDVRKIPLGGEVYRYTSLLGSLQFHSDGAFQAELVPGAFPVKGEADCLALLEKLDFAGAPLERTDKSATFRQLWQGTPLFTQQVTLELREGCVTAMTAGRRLAGEPVEDLTRSIITVPTALFQLFNGINALGDVCSSIDAIDQGYVSTASLSGPGTMTPVWRVSTDTGSYQLNLLTGGLSRIS